MNSFDVYATVIFPIVGGIIAGIIVILIEWGFRSLYERGQRRKAINGIGEFFGEWESRINSLAARNVPQIGTSYTREQIQFAFHQHFLRRSHITMDRWSKFLPEQQTEEMRQFISEHEGAEIGIIPAGKVMSQEMYNNFFRRAREIKWLKF